MSRINKIIERGERTERGKWRKRGSKRNSQAMTWPLRKRMKKTTLS